LVGLVGALVAGGAALGVARSGTSSGNLAPAHRLASTSLPELPKASPTGLNVGGNNLLSTIEGTGDQVLTPFTLQGPTLYIQFACRGRGSMTMTGYFTVHPCDGAVEMDSVPVGSPTVVHSEIEAPKSTMWEIYVSSGS
jgi:hypothetical protein